MSKPSPTSVPGYMQKYINLVVEDDLITGFNNQQQLIQQMLASISEEKSAYAYAPGKWTLKAVLQHLIDSERIFSYRALCFARKETISLPGFDENDYADSNAANVRSWASLCEEFLAVRTATVLLFKSFTPEEMIRTGVANNNPNSVVATGFITLGHFNHHKNIIAERYF